MVNTLNLPFHLHILGHFAIASPTVPARFITAVFLVPENLGLLQ